MPVPHWPILLGFCLGILGLQNCADLPFESHPAVSPTLVVTAISMLLWAVSRDSPHRLAQSFLLLTSTVIFGFSYAHWRAEIRLADALDSAWEGRDVVIEGNISRLPQRLTNSSRPAWRFEFQVDKTLSAEAKIPNNLRLSWYGQLPISRLDEDEASDTETSPTETTLQPGDRWRLKVRLKRPHGNANPGGFDYEGWLFEHNIRATGYVRGSSDSRDETTPVYLGKAAWRFDLWIEQLRDHIRHQMLTLLPPETHPQIGILVGLAIGDQAAISPSQWQLFNQTGLTHLMVVSGSHITLLAAVMAAFTNKIWRRSPALVLHLPAQKAAAIVGWTVAFFYTWMSGFGIPAMRTLCMVSVVTLALFRHQNTRPSHTLGLSLGVVLLVDPWAIFSGGFWLSFATVGALLLAAQAAGKSWISGLKAAWSAQWAATLATIPLLLMLFQQLPLISPFANAIAIPLIGFVVTPLALLGALFCLLPAQFGMLAYWSLFAASKILDWLEIGLEPLSHLLPLWQTPAPALWAIILAAVGVLLLLLPKGLPGRIFLGIFSLLPALFWPAAHPEEGQWWADIIDVGQGQAVLIRTAHESLLYDSGPRYGPIVPQTASPPDAAQRVILPFLRAEGVHQLDRLLISHRDSDHAGGTATIKANLSVLSTMSSKVEPTDTPCLAGDQWTWSGVKFEILHPNAELLDIPPKNRNALSCVLRVSSDQGSFLLTGDLPENEETALVARLGDQLNTTVLLAPHHGSATSSSARFLSAVNPEAVVVSAGYLNRYGHPNSKVMERYQTHQLRVWRTDTQGAIQIRPLGKEMWLSGWREQHRRYLQE